jgi:hypothetical protein
MDGHPAEMVPGHDSGGNDSPHPTKKLNSALPQREKTSLALVVDRPRVRLVFSFLDGIG